MRSWPNAYRLRWAPAGWWAESGVLLVEADVPIVGQELRLRSTELLAAFRTAPGGFAARELRVVVRRV